MYDKPSLEILEVNYSISPGGIDEFEVYSLDERDHSNPPIFSSPLPVSYTHLTLPTICSV